MLSQAPTQPVFYYDLGSPRCYLLAERIMADLPVVPEWEPVLAADLGIHEPDARPRRDRAPRRRAPDCSRCAGRGSGRRTRGTATLAATYAKHIGRAVAFSLACFRQAFAGGRDLGDESTVLIAAAACEMHPSAVLKGIGLRSVTAGARAGRRPARGPRASRRCRRSRSGSACSTELEHAAEALASRRGRDDEGQPAV